MVFTVKGSHVNRDNKVTINRVFSVCVCLVAGLDLPSWKRTKLLNRPSRMLLSKLDYTMMRTKQNFH